MISGFATATPGGDWGFVIAAVGVGAKDVWAGTGSGVGKRAGVGVMAVAGAGWPVAKAGLVGWTGLAAWGGSAGSVDAGESGTRGEAPEPDALEPINPGTSAGVSSAWLRWFS